MKTLLVTLSLFLATGAAQARNDSTEFSCLPTDAPNGLGIEYLLLDLSDEDPDGLMTIAFEGADKSVRINIDYEADPTRYYVISTSSKTYSDLGVSIVRDRDNWTATVKRDSVDTFSELSCERI